MADSKKEGADFTGVTVVDWDSENNWFIRYAKRYKISLPELIDLIFKLWIEYKPIKIGVEKKAFEFQVKPFLEIKARETQIKPVVVQLEDGGTAKNDRIKGALEGRFESGKIWFLKDSFDDQKILRGELYDFPSAKHDDLSDSLSYIQQLGQRPFGKDKEVKPSIAGELEEYRRTQNKTTNNRDVLHGLMD
jgi:phage terminase large subunit-like protein